MVKVLAVFRVFTPCSAFLPTFRRHILPTPLNQIQSSHICRQYVPPKRRNEASKLQVQNPKDDHHLKNNCGDGLKIYTFSGAWIFFPENECGSLFRSVENTYETTRYRDLQRTTMCLISFFCHYPLCLVVTASNAFKWPHLYKRLFNLKTEINRVFQTLSWK